LGEIPISQARDLPLFVPEGGRRCEAARGGTRPAAGVHLRGDAVVGTQDGLLAKGPGKARGRPGEGPGKARGRPGEGPAGKMGKISEMYCKNPMTRILQSP